MDPTDEMVLATRARISAGGNRPDSGSVSPIPQLLAPGKIIDLVFAQDIATNGKQFAVLVTVCAMIPTLIALLAVATTMGGAAMLVLPLMFIAILVALLLPRRSAVAAARTLASGATTDALPALLPTMFAKVRGFGGIAGLREFLKTLARQGVTDQAIRILKLDKKGKPTPALEPLDFPFEAQPLNEADSSLIRTQSGGSAGDAADGGTALKIRRNILLKGGWALLLLFGLQFGIAVFTAIVTRNPRYVAMYTWGAALLLLMFVPVGTRFWGATQWLVVPGGVLLRRAAPGSSAWKVRLFERRNSLLAVAAVRKRRFCAIVANASTAEFAIVTRAEAEFLLRAWISPVRTPAIEMLQELG